MEVLKLYRIISLRKKAAGCLQLRLQIGLAQHNYLIQYHTGEFRLFDLPEDLRRVLRPQTDLSWRLLAALNDFLDGKSLVLPLNLTVTSPLEQLEAA